MSDDVKGLVDRLRGKAVGQNVGISTHLFDGAATALLAQRAEIARLKGFAEGMAEEFGESSHGGDGPVTFCTTPL